jgi:NADH-quinone oxidoreductase subunit G
MAETVKLFVNGQEVEVASGKNLIDALKVVGIEIPHFCYHPALGADGNCRMCLVGIEDGRPPLVPACKTPVSEGLKVQLDTDKIKKIQHDVMELELINHPVDCPVCDQAGECTLQDYYMTYDHQASRMRVPQVVKEKKMDLGCGVIHDQERCVLCARCVRFTRLITKTGELGIINRSDEARVSLFPGRPLNNRYALNIVDLCPVGAMTSKDFRFKQRAWFLKRDKGICHGCSMGCNIFVDHNREKYGDDLIYRFRPRFNPQVNGYFICDTGRMTYHRENEGRLSTARIDHNDSSVDLALETAKKRIEGSDRLLILVSPNCSMEQLLAVKSLAAVSGAALSGFSDGMVKAGEADGYLIQDDQSANRAGLHLLGIDTSREFFETALVRTDTLVSFNNDPSTTGPDQPWAKRLTGIQTIAVSSHDTLFSRQAGIAIPAASHTEYAGCVINKDGMLQTFGQAVRKNNPSLEIGAIAGILGATLTDREALQQALKRAIPALAAIGCIPEEGLKLTVNEASHVTA